MKWEKKIKKRNPIVGKKVPEIGDTKEVVKFALFPVKIDRTKRVWLERYIEVYTYKKYTIRRENKDFFLMGEPVNIWETIDWKLIEKKYYYKSFSIKLSNKTLSEMLTSE